MLGARLGRQQPEGAQELLDKRNRQPDHRAEVSAHLGDKHARLALHGVGTRFVE